MKSARRGDHQTASDNHERRRQRCDDGDAISGVNNSRKYSQPSIKHDAVQLWRELLQ
jgi:hypothetical protein